MIVDNNVKSVLVDLRSVVFSDLGILLTIRDKYKLKTPKPYLENSDKRIIFDLIKRMNKNPLSIILKEEDIDINTIYNELYEKDTEYILKISPSTMVLELLKSMIIGMGKDTLHITFLCKNRIEEQYIKDNYGDSVDYTILEDTLSSNVYEIVFIHDIDLIPKIKLNKNTIIYLSNMAYNLVFDNGLFRLPDLYYNDINLSRQIYLIDIFNLDPTYTIYG